MDQDGAELAERSLSEPQEEDCSTDAMDVTESCCEDTSPDNRPLKRKSNGDAEESQERKRQQGPAPFQKNGSIGVDQVVHSERVVSASDEVEASLEQRSRSKGNADESRDQIEPHPIKSPLVDPFFEELAGILQETGGLNQPQDVHVLEGLMRKEQRLRHRWTLLTVTEQSSQNCQEHLVKGEGLQTLERWLVEARDANKPQFLTKIIKCLSVLPVDFESLTKSTIGKTVGPLRHHDCISVKNAANLLVAKWKSIVEEERNRNGSNAEPDKVADGGKEMDGEGDVASMGCLSKPLPVRKQGGSEDAQISNTTCEEHELLYKKPAHKNRHLAEANSPGNISSILRALVSGPTHLPGSNEALHDDKCEEQRTHLPSDPTSDDKSGAPEKQQKVGREPEEISPMTQEKTASGQIIETGNPPALSDESPPCSNEACIPLESDAVLKTNLRAEPAKNASLESDPVQQQSQNAPCIPQDAEDKNTSCELPEGCKQNPDMRAACTSKLGTLPGNRDSNRVGSINTPFLPQRPPAPIATKVPKDAHQSPRWPSNQKKTNSKKVSWAPEDNLASVRWFKMDDPPENVCKDSFYTPEELLVFYSTYNDDCQHDPFSSAARLEHLNESQAIRASKQLNLKEENIPMISKVEWSRPPRVGLSPEWKLAFGGGSLEKAHQSRREENVVAMRNAKNTIIPRNPMEPDAEPLHQGSPVRIPYTAPNRPESNHVQAVVSKPLVLQAQGSLPQPQGGGLRPILLQNQGCPGYIGQGHYVPQQVSLHHSGHPQTYVLLQSSVGNQQLMMSTSSGLPMVVNNRPNQSIIVPANGNQPLGIPGGHQQVLVHGNPNALQMMHGQPVQFQMPRRNVFDGQLQGVQQMVFSGMNPGLSAHVHPNHPHQQVIVDGVPNHNQQSHRGLAPDCLMPDQGLQTSSNKIPGKRPG